MVITRTLLVTFSLLFTSVAFGVFAKEKPKKIDLLTWCMVRDVCGAPVEISSTGGFSFYILPVPHDGIEEFVFVGVRGFGVKQRFDDLGLSIFMTDSNDDGKFDTIKVISDAGKLVQEINAIDLSHNERERLQIQFDAIVEQAYNNLLRAMNVKKI